MKLLRRHPYLITLALLLVVFPVPVLAATFGEEVLYGLVVGVFGLFVRLAAMLLNFGINTFVIDFGGVYATTGVGYAVDTTWIIIRDFVNMAFIFGFVYIGFKMILSSNDSNTRRWLVNLLLAALLVNFSLFITKITIDFSNQLAAQIVSGGLSSEYYTNSKGLTEVDIGQSFLSRMGITSIFNTDGVMPAGTSYGYIFGSAILFMVTAFVFAAGGILLIIRFAVLNLFLVLSPLMFLSWILPPLKETMNRYWGMFLGRVFFAPIYLLFIYFSLQIITGLQTATSSATNPNNLANPQWAGTFQAVGANSSARIQESTLGTLPFFVLICVFMIASLVIAQKMGADGGAKAVGLGKSLANKARRATGSATVGLAGVAGQQTVGRGARALANSNWAQQRAAEGKIGGRAFLGATRGVADSSFDARRVGGLGKALGIGEGKKGGLETRIKDKQKKDEELMKSLKTEVTPEESDRLKRAEEVKLEAEKQAKEDESSVAGDMQGEDGRKSAEELESEINSASSALSRKVAAGAMTDSEREAAEKGISRKRKVQNEIREQKRLQDEIDSSNTRVATASSPEELKSAREEQERLKDEFDKRRNYEERKKTADKRLKVLGDSSKLKAEAAQNASKEEDKIKYKNQIAYLAEQSKRAERAWDPRASKESVKNLKKKIGGTAEEMAKKDKENKAKQDLAKQIKEIQDAEAKGEKPKEDKPEEAGH